MFCGKRIQFDEVIKYFVIKSLTPAKIHSALKNCSPSFSAVNKWAAESKGRTSNEDD